MDIGEVGQITNLTHAQRTINLSRSYVDPVVFVQSPSNNEAQPMVARVTNVQPNQFTIFAAEPSNGDVIHGNETVTYVVLEAGTHTLFDGTQIEVGKVGTSATVGNRLSNFWEFVNFESSFDAAPVVLSQIQTTNGTENYLQTRYLSTSATTVVMALEPEENRMSAVAEQTIGYLAIEGGTGFWNGMRYEAGVTPDAVSNNPYQFTYDSFFLDPSSLLTSLASYDNFDNAHLRVMNPSGNGVQLKVQEDTTFDAETGHTTEEVAYLALGGQGLLTAQAPTFAIGEVGSISNLTHANRTINLNGSYTDPVVFVQSPSNNEAQPAVARVTNVQSDQFTVYLAEPSNGDVLHGNETATYVVLERGMHTLPDGTRIEVGKVDTAATVGNRLSNSWEFVNFTTSFSAAPVVLSQIQTTNNASSGINYLQTRYLMTLSSQVILGLEPEESVMSAVGQETVGYLAIEPGAGMWGTMAYEVGPTPNAVTQNLYQLTYGSSFSSIPNLLTSLASYDSGDNAHLRVANPTSTGVQLKVEEDTTFDPDTSHTTEVAVYLAIEGSGALTATASISPPEVIDFEQNGGAGPTGSLDTLAYTFNEPVSISAGDLDLTDDNAGGANVDLTGILFGYNASTYTATWDFTAMSAMGPSTYTAVLTAAGITDDRGTPLDGDSNGTAGGDYERTVEVAASGDANADGVVDGIDFGIWDANKFTVSNDWSKGDFNRDGAIDTRDFNIWNNNKYFGSNIVAQSASALRVPRAAAAHDLSSTPLQISPRVNLVRVEQRDDSTHSINSSLRQLVLPGEKDLADRASGNVNWGQAVVSRYQRDRFFVGHFDLILGRWLSDRDLDFTEIDDVMAESLADALGKF